MHGYLSSRDRSDDNKRLFSRRDRVGKRSLGRFVGQILLAGEEAQEGATLLRVVVADRAAQHGIAGLDRVENRAQRGSALDYDRDLAADMGQCSQMLGEYHSDHASFSINKNSPRVCNS